MGSFEKDVLSIVINGSFNFPTESLISLFLTSTALSGEIHKTGTFLKPVFVFVYKSNLLSIKSYIDRSIVSIVDGCIDISLFGIK